MRCSDLRDADLTGATLDGALLDGAIANDSTLWPKGFDTSMYALEGPRVPDPLQERFSGRVRLYNYVWACLQQ